MHGTLAEMTGNDWNILHVPRLCFIALQFFMIFAVQKMQIFFWVRYPDIFHLCVATFTLIRLIKDRPKGICK